MPQPNSNDVKNLTREIHRLNQTLASLGKIAQTLSVNAVEIGGTLKELKPTPSEVEPTE